MGCWRRSVASAVQQSLPEREDVRLPLSRNRRAIAVLMAASASIPQFGLDADVDLTELLALRKRTEISLSATR